MKTRRPRPALLAAIADRMLVPDFAILRRPNRPRLICP
jgi:hypothetical protein